MGFCFVLFYNNADFSNIKYWSLNWLFISISNMFSHSDVGLYKHKLHVYAIFDSAHVYIA
jgi:hypothetical protein